ncbi:short-chain dehydrogenase/reductase [Amycolatopsis mediterranei S699]|uniref:Short-chain dehydrogenase/reductase n=3 Tax=Amycolatopsis mediterranei TaxID=33910 RepID=A0A0H3DE95_AMYMU|nr:SDR family NAD(P)-dependent oxidoreductase [Amycolatopsis mediterranei]ADJ47954.1 short-chain dehydrogenase/reductase [Amycolatopsis mediterranei U32]AEK44854.1 short-chain dehydrogenase/reductase [Amycolatopsis mediterranei S699]AFO79665.1 short-chain dehydrogenase/reductase [Amycolatopsis mediterranei S699]AGT86793.1 short-chain dehydrogenase/reductase [Amycolatopsis mediterranei RB]KDO10775.1 oxidoreductase [Amycolatopsis mediterranei]
MTQWTENEIPDQTGRTVVITGAGRGLGLITARALAGAGARVVLGVRDLDRGRRAVAGLPGRFDVRPLDVADLGSVRAFAAAWTGDLDVLINNAGVMDTPAARTADGFDRQTATNYLGPFVLTNLLLEHVTDRVVHVTSQLHRQGRIDLADLDWRTRPYHSMAAYRASKLAVVLHSLELQRRLDARGSVVRSVLASPGIARTGLAAHSRSDIVNRVPFLTNSPEQGALSLLYAATQDVPGNAYVGPGGLGGLRGSPAVGRPGRNGLDEELAARLWDVTAELVGPAPRSPEAADGGGVYICSYDPLRSPGPDRRPAAPPA